MRNLKDVVKHRNKLTKPEIIRTNNLDRQKRLKDMVEVHGVEIVAAACGLTMSTVNQYIRVKNPNNIGEESIAIAEQILN
jgi:hypothetical protein